jgi:hypothetical protein
MPTLTTKLRLNILDFDQVPWDEYVNQNWLILDATVGQLFGISDFVGVWANSTQYLVGQTAVDQDSSMWVCAVAHTSSASPTTFAQDRTNNPSWWTQSASSVAARVMDAIEALNRRLTALEAR